MTVGQSVLVPTTEGNVRGNDAFLRRISLTTSINGRVGFLNGTAADGNSLRRIQDHMDDLDVRIAMREFEEAVLGIEKGHLSRSSPACLLDILLSIILKPPSLHHFPLKMNSRL